MAALDERLDNSRRLADTFRIMQDATGFDAADVVQSMQSLWCPTHGYARHQVLQRYGERERLFEQGYSIDAIAQMPSGSFGIPTENRHARGPASFFRIPVRVATTPTMTGLNACGVLMIWLKVAIVISAFLAIAIVLPID